MASVRRAQLAAIVFGVALSLFFIGRFIARAADGSGSASVTPSSVRAGVVGTYAFTTTSTESMSSGEVSLTVPSSWTVPQGTSGVAGYTTATSTAGTIADVLDTTDSLTGWAAGTACANGLILDATTKHEGTNSLRCNNGNEATGDRWYKNITAQNWSAYSKVGFWIYSSSAIANTRLTFAYDNNTNIASPIEELNLGAISANTWTYVVVNFTSAAASRTSVVSYGFVVRHGTGLDNVTVRVDDLLIGPGAPTFPGGGDVRVRLLQLASGQSVRINYGVGGGTSGATAPTSTGIYTFTAKTRVSDSGTLQAIGTSPSIQVTAATATRFVIVPPGNAQVGTSVPVTIQALDPYGNVDTSYQQDVTLQVSGSAIGGGLVNIVNGIGSGSVIDSVAETVHLTLADTQGTGLNVSSAQDTIFSPGPTARFTLSATTTTMTAGTRLGLTVNRQDSYGNAVTSGSSVVYLYSSSAGVNKKFFNAASGGSQITSVTIGSGSSSAAFWTYDERSGAPTITASDHATAPDGAAGIIDGTLGITIVPASVSAYFLTNPGDVTAGSRLGYAVTRRDVYSNEVTAGSNVVYLTHDSTGAHAAFYLASSGGSPITSFVISDGTSTSPFWYYDDKAGSLTITASDHAPPDGGVGIVDAMDAVTVLPGAVAKFTLTDPGDMTAGTRLGYTVTRSDAFDNAVVSGSNTVYLYSDSTSVNKKFYNAAVGGGVITSFAIGAGASTGTFWYFDDLVGDWTITASDHTPSPDGAVGIIDATDAVHVAPAPIVATRFVLLPVTDGSTDAASTVTIQAQDAEGNLAVTYQQDVTLNASGSATGDGLVNIVNGVGTMAVSDHVAETVHLTLSDTQGTGLDVSSAQDAVFAPGAISKFVLSNPGDMVGGTRLSYVVTREDQYGNAVLIGTTPVYLYTNSTGVDAKFYAVASGGSPTLSVDITAGTSTVSFWYSDTEAGDWTITASDHTPAADGAVGIDDATDAVHVTPPVIIATRFVILTVATGTTAGPVTVTVEAQNDAGVVQTTYQQDVTLNASGSATGDGLVNIVNGVGTMAVSDHVAETVHLTLSDTQGTGLDVTSHQDLVIEPGTTAKFVISHPGNFPAGHRLPYVITRQDQYGNAVQTGSTVVYMYTSSTDPNAAFYDAEIGGGIVTSLVIGSGSSDASVWYYAERAGSVLITASDSAIAPNGAVGIEDTSDTTTVIPSDTVAFVLSHPGTMTAGSRAAYVATREDAYGNLVTAGSRRAYLYSDSAGTHEAFYPTAVGGVAMTSVDFVDGTSTVSIWYFDDHAGVFDVTISDNNMATDGSMGIVDGVDSMTVLPGPTAAYSLTDPGDMTANTRIGYEISRRDAYGNATTNGDEVVYLYTSSGGGLSGFYAFAAGGSPIASVTIPSSQASVPFYYQDGSVGSWLVTASEHTPTPDGDVGIVDATDTVMVIAAPIIATQFVVTSATTSVAGDAMTVTVRAEDDAGNVDTTFHDDVTLNVSGSASGAGVVDLVNGVGTMSVSDTVAETIRLSLTDSFGTGLRATSFVDVVVTPAATVRYLLTHPGDMVAGTRLGYLASREDRFGNAVTTGSEVAYLYTTSGAGSSQFYDAASGGSVMTSLVFVSGSSQATFWFSDVRSGATSVTVSDHPSSPDGAAGIADATDVLTVFAASLHHFVLNDPGDMTAGTRIRYLVSREDAYGNLVTTGATTVYLTSDSAATTTAFYPMAVGGIPMTSLAIAAGDSSASFWYEDATIGTWAVTVSDHTPSPDGATGIVDATDAVRVTAAGIVATRFVILPLTGTTVGGSVLVTIQAQDADGNVDTTFQRDVTLVLSGSATGGGLVDLVNGVGTATMTDATAESVHLTLSDTQGTGLDATSEQTVVFTRGTTVAQPMGSTGGAAAPVPIPPKTILRFVGHAYPGATVTVLGELASGRVSLTTKAVTARDGNFSVDVTGPFQGFTSYDVQITDRNGQLSPEQSFTLSVPTGEVTERNIFAAPTVETEWPAVLRGVALRVFGFVTPGSRVAATMDGVALSAPAPVGEDGSYRLSLDTIGIPIGKHEIIVRQIAADGATSAPSVAASFSVVETLTPAADLNNDGKIDISDWSIFLSRWQSGDSASRQQLDFNGDGTVDIQDFSIFIRSIRPQL